MAADAVALVENHAREAVQRACEEIGREILRMVERAPLTGVRLGFALHVFDAESPRGGLAYFSTLPRQEYVDMLRRVVEKLGGTLAV